MGNYVTREEAKDYTRITYLDLGFSTENEYDSFIDQLIDQAEEIIDNYCRVPSGFFKDDGLNFTELHDWDESGIIHLKYYPIIAITKVELDTAGYNQTANWTEISSTYYYTELNSGIIKIVGKSPGHVEKSVRVTYTAGYSSTPYTIRNATLNLISNILHGMLVRLSGETVNTGDFTIRYSAAKEAFTSEIKALLGPYRRGLAMRG